MVMRLRRSGERTRIGPLRVPSEQLGQVTTTDAPGVQIAFNNEFELTADPGHYVYWIEIRIVRTSPDAVVRVYSTTLKDVL